MAGIRGQGLLYVSSVVLIRARLWLERGAGGKRPGAVRREQHGGAVFARSNSSNK
jgi:hypothetical protein